MFNPIKLGDSNQIVNFNATSTGHLQKSHPKSKFIRFQKSSSLETTIFSINQKPYIIGVDRFDKIEITVLQILVFGDNYFLCEIIENKDIK